MTEKGNPKSQMEAGSIRVLTYSDVVIKFKDNVVVSIKPVPAEPKKIAEPTPTPAKALTIPEQIAFITKQLDITVTRVRAIINQEVTAVPIDPGVKPPEFYFHDGATRPEFNTVDVRATRETPYDSHDFITWKGHPDLMWPGKELEFNSMTKYFYADRTVPKKKLTEAEMLEVNRLYRVIGAYEQQLWQLGYTGPVP